MDPREDDGLSTEEIIRLLESALADEAPLELPDRAA